MAPESGSGESALVAILRGVTPERVSAIGRALYESGIRIIEVPLNSPDPFRSIEQLAKTHGSDCLIGAGTVLQVEEVRRTQAAGGRLIVAPNCDVAVIECAVQLGLRVMPGVATATEAFNAIHGGATQLKLFPAITYGPQHLRALKAVLPRSVQVYPVGGIGAADIPAWLAAGADGFGFGSELFRPEYSLEDISARARELVRALRDARHKLTGQMQAANNNRTSSGGHS
jgi:2-dehydro-3-deoxyphosphogalactonate aldolase